MTWKLLPDKKISPLSAAHCVADDEIANLLAEMTDLERMDSNVCSYSYRALYQNEHEWLYERITGAVLDSNVNNYGFKLHGIPMMYYVEIDSGSFIGLSSDYFESGRETNKLSIHLSLNEDYTRGDYSIHMPNPHVVGAKKGVLTMFPSFLPWSQKATGVGTKRMVIGTVSGLPFS